MVPPILDSFPLFDRSFSHYIFYHLTDPFQCDGHGPYVSNNRIHHHGHGKRGKKRLIIQTILSSTQTGDPQDYPSRCLIYPANGSGVVSSIWIHPDDPLFRDRHHLSRLGQYRSDPCQAPRPIQNQVPILVKDHPIPYRLRASLLNTRFEYPFSLIRTGGRHPILSGKTGRGRKLVQRGIYWNYRVQRK